MTTIIKNGTIVTGGPDLQGGSAHRERGHRRDRAEPFGRRRTGCDRCYVMPGGIDPHTHLEMPFMGTYSSDDFEERNAGGARGRHHHGGDFALPNPGQSMLDALTMWDNKTSRATCDYSFHMAITCGRAGLQRDGDDRPRQGHQHFKHFMAYKGALMVDDDEMFSSFQRCAELGALPLVHAENGDVVAQMQAKLMAEGNDGPEAHAYSRPPEVEGEATNRAIMIADMAGCPVYIVHTSCEQAHEAIRRARQKACASMASR